MQSLLKRQKRWTCSNSNLSEDGNECKVDAEYTFTRSEDITYDTSRSGINNIRVYYDEKNPRKIKFDGKR